MNNSLKFFICIFCFIFISSCVSSKKENPRPDNKNGSVNTEALTSAPEITFETLEHNFGKVHAGEKAGWYFKYKNTGSEPLLITSVRASCGCTVTEYQKEPLSPGKEGLIKVVFDTSGRSGKQSKSITIETNAHQPKVLLKISAEIISD